MAEIVIDAAIGELLFPRWQLQSQTKTTEINAGETPIAHFQLAVTRPKAPKTLAWFTCGTFRNNSDQEVEIIAIRAILSHTSAEKSNEIDIIKIPSAIKCLAHRTVELAPLGKRTVITQNLAKGDVFAAELEITYSGQVLGAQPGLFKIAAPILTKCASQVMVVENTEDRNSYFLSCEARANGKTLRPKITSLEHDHLDEKLDPDVVLITPESFVGESRKFMV